MSVVSGACPSESRAEFTKGSPEGCVVGEGVVSQTPEAPSLFT